jgi:hypothetical protein
MNLPCARRLAPLVLLLALLGPGLAAIADDSGLGDDPRALAAWKLLEDGKLIALREAAEAMLRQDRRSWAGHFLLAHALHVSEGQLPQALRHAREARRLFEERHGKNPASDAPWLWHASMLDQIANLLAEMDRYEEQLAVLAAHDASYDPDRPAMRAWPLMRLKRWDEARRAAEAGLASEDAFQQTKARTSLCAIESELQRREAGYRACLDAAAADRKADYHYPESYSNAAYAALAMLRFDEAEKLLDEARRHFVAGTASNPWLDLMLRYVEQARPGEATDAMRRMFAWRDGQPPAMDEQTWAETRLAAARFLIYAGRGPQAARITAQTLDRPDRTGLTSADTRQLEAGAALLDRQAALLAAEREAERASATYRMESLKARLRSWRYALRAWSSGRRAAALIDEALLVSTLRPYLAGGIPVDVDVDAVGPGVVASGLSRARRLDTAPGFAPYFDQVESQAALAQGRRAAALAAAERAIGALPRAEALRRANAAALGARAALESGRTADAARLFDLALQVHPGALRAPGLRLPVAWRAGGDPLSRAALDLLRGSPRLASDRGLGFEVAVEGTRACLAGPGGRTYACASIDPRPGESERDVASRLALEFHERVFAPRLDLSQADLNSLDGSPTAGGSRGERRFEDILEGLGR